MGTRDTLSDRVLSPNYEFHLGVALGPLEALSDPRYAPIIEAIKEDLAFF